MISVKAAVTGALTLACLFAAKVAVACSCMPTKPCGFVGTATAIFVGTPVSSEAIRLPDGSSGIRFRFDVHDRIQNVDEPAVEVITAADTAACGYPFTIGIKYLVYAEAHANVFSASFCSRTGPLELRQNDLALLREAAAGSIQPRLFGTVAGHKVRLDGFYLHSDEVPGIPGVLVRATDHGRVRESVTDQHGQFSIAGLSRGTYALDIQLPRNYEMMFDRRLVSEVDSCAGLATIFVTTVPLRGTVHPARGEALVNKVMLRIAQVGPDGGVSFDRSTLAFADSDGNWKAEGLPAGKYLVGVSAFDAASAQNPYPTMWYPDATQPEDASIIAVTDDESRSIDFQLPSRLPTITLSGTTVATDGTPMSASVSVYDVDATPRDSGGERDERQSRAFLRRRDARRPLSGSSDAGQAARRQIGPAGRDR